MQIDNKDKKEGVKISRRKRADLTKEFEEFKQKIQEFEDKNQQIISRIREAYTFKKKAVETQSPQRATASHHSRVVYYQQGDEVESVASSCDYSKNIVLDGNLVGYPTHSQQLQIQDPHSYMVFDPYTQANRRNQQELYFKNSNLSSRAQPNKPYPTSTEYLEYPQLQDSREAPYQGHRQRSRKETANFYEVGQKELESKVHILQQKNRQLLQIIQERQSQLEKVRGHEIKVKSYVQLVKRLFADQFENYHEEVVLQKFFDLEKYLKKCDNKLKKLSLKIKDTIEDRRAHHNIQRSKSKRRSISRHEYKHSEGSSADMRDSWVSGPHKQGSRVMNIKKQGGSQQRTITDSRQKQFSEIAAGYQGMIKAKTQEIDRTERQLKEEVRLKQQYAAELAKTKILLDEKERFIKQLEIPSLRVKENSGSSTEIKQLTEKLLRSQEQLKRFQQNQKQLSAAIQRIEKGKKAALEEQKQNYLKNISKKNSIITEMEERLKEWESIHQKQIEQMKEKVITAEKKNIEKDCEIVSLNNKVKKLENQVSLREQKLQQLQKLVIKDNDPDLLERSMSIDSSILSTLEVKNLQEAVRRLEDQLDQKSEVIQQLEKLKYQLTIQVSFQRQQKVKLQSELSGMQQRIQYLQKEGEDRDISSEKENNRQFQQIKTLLEECEKERFQLREEREELITKNNEFLEDIKKLKQENLSLNRELIKLNSQLSFNEGQFLSLENKLTKIKEENTEIKSRLGDHQILSQEKQKELKTRVQELTQLIQQYQLTISQLQGNRHSEEKEEENLLNSMHVSQVSFNLTAGQKAQQDDTDQLRERLKEVQAAFEMKEAMQQQIQNEYRQNLQRLRVEMNEKQSQLKKIYGENEALRKQIKGMQEQYRDDVSFQNYKITLYEEKIVQIECELNACRESEQKLNQLLHELTQNMREKSEQRIKLMNELEIKEKALEELKELLEIKEIKEINRQQSKQSTFKDYSLRISGEHSDQFSDMAEVSYFSNISDVFKRDDVLQQKMKRGKTSRQQFIKLFTKTSAYIKSLKANIELKDKRIKTLERQLTAIKNQEKRSWSGSKQKKIQQSRPFRTQHDRDDSIQQYKDYQSVQIDTRRSKSYEIIKELQHQKDLAIEQNKMLLNQIQLLQDQLLRAEEQENSLVKIKDLYKEEIKKIMEKNQIHTQEFEAQIKNLRQELDECQSYHNWEAIKQLFIKLVMCVGAMEDPTNKNRRDQKRKQLQEFIKVACSILRLQVQVRDKLISSIRK